MKTIALGLSTLLFAMSLNAAVIGKYEGAQDGTQVDFEVLTFTRGINIDARLDPTKDSRNSAFQGAQLTVDQYKKLFESSEEIKDLKIDGIFDVTANASGDVDNREIILTEIFKSDGGTLVSEKILKLNSENGELVKASLESSKRRGILGIIPLWMKRVFKKSIDLRKVEDGLLLRDDGVDICRVTSEAAIAQGAKGGSYSELRAACDLD